MEDEGALAPWLDEEGELFEFSAQATAPSKDFNQIIVSPTQVIYRWWKISHRQSEIQRLQPGEIKEHHDEFLKDDETQDRITAAFGQNMCDYIVGLCEGKIDYLERIPEKSIKQIISYIDLQDIGRLAQTNKRFHQLCEDDSVWRDLFSQAGTITDELVQLAKVQGWKKLFFSDKLRIQLELTRSRKRAAAGALSAPAAGKRRSARITASQKDK